MVGIARHALKSPFHALTVVGLLAVLSLIFPFVSLLSGAIVSLIILTQGLKSGLRVIVLSVIATSAMTWLTMGSPMVGIMVGLVQWLPMVVLAELLRKTQSLSVVILFSLVLGVIAASMQFFFWPDLGLLWQDMVKQFLIESNQAARYDELSLAIEQLVQLFLVFIVGVMVSTYISTLMFGRWLQAKLVDSPGYNKEFYGIKLGKKAGLIAVLAVAVSAVVATDYLVAVAIVIGSGFLFQGLAVVHVRANRSSRKVLFIVLFYFLLLVFPHVVALTTFVGIIDNWFDFRGKSDLVKPTNG